MADDTPGAVLRKKLGAPKSKERPPLTAHRALRLALSQTADALFGLETEFRGIEDDRINQAAAAGSIMERAVHFAVDGPNRGVGLCAASPDLVAALIEVQTTGAVSPAAAVERVATATDAAIAEAYLDTVIVEMGRMLAGVEGEEWAQGQRLGRYVADLHQIALMLADVEYRRLRVAIGFSAEGKEGELLLILPARPFAPTGEDLSRHASDAARDWARRIEDSVLASTVRLSAILHRVGLSLTRVRSLKADDTIPVPADALKPVWLEGLNGRCVAMGRLGSSNGARAVRLLGVGATMASTADASDQDQPNADIDLAMLGLADAPPTDLPSLDDLSGQIVTPADLPDLGLATDEVGAQPDPMSSDNLPDLDIATPEGDQDLKIDAAPMSFDDLPELDIDTAN